MEFKVFFKNHGRLDPSKSERALPVVVWSVPFLRPISLPLFQILALILLALSLLDWGFSDESLYSIYDLFEKDRSFPRSMEKRIERHEQKFPWKEARAAEEAAAWTRARRSKCSSHNSFQSEGHPETPETERCWRRKSRSQRPLPEAEIFAPATPEIYLPDEEWPEEPEAYEELPEAEEFEDDGEEVQVDFTPMNSSSTNFQPLIFAPGQAEKSTKEKNIVRQNIRILEETFAL